MGKKIGNKTLINKYFGKLFVVSLSRRKEEGHFIFKCRCVCNKIIYVRKGNLIHKNTKSCGCKRITHGMYKTKEYKTWESLKARCNNKNSVGYTYYGARGIKVCKRWAKFKHFLNDMGKAPIGFCIDRINNEKGYTKSNCRWVCRKISHENRRCTLWLKYKKHLKTLKDWAASYNLPYDRLRQRYLHKWKPEYILSTKIFNRHNNPMRTK